MLVLHLCLMKAAASAASSATKVLGSIGERTRSTAVCALLFGRFPQHSAVLVHALSLRFGHREGLGCSLLQAVHPRRSHENLKDGV